MFQLNWRWLLRCVAQAVLCIFTFEGKKASKIILGDSRVTPGFIFVSNNLDSVPQNFFLSNILISIHFCAMFFRILCEIS